MISGAKNRYNLLYFVLAVQALSNAATFLSVPLLALYLTKDLGYKPFVMGAVLTALLISTRLSPLFTGALADRYGYKKFVIGGLLIRFVGFIMIGYCHSEVITVVSACLIGLGGSFYESGTYGYLAQVNKERQDAFYLNNQALNLGVVAGPLIAFFVPHSSYGDFFWGSALVFLLLAVINVFVFPKGERSLCFNSSPSFKSLMADFYSDRKFLVFNIVCIPWWVLFSQLYVLMPLAFSQKISTEGDELIIYLINGSVGVLLTLLLLRQFKIVSPLSMMIVGHVVLVAAYLIPIASETVGAFLFMVVVFSIAETFIMPAIDAYVAKIAPAGREANYFGIANVPWIIGASVGNMFGAGLLESSEPVTPWVFMVLIALIGAMFICFFKCFIRDPNA